MQFDIIPMTEQELNGLSVIQLKLLRTAQKTKDEWQRDMQKSLAEYQTLLYAGNVENSSLYAQKHAELTAEYDHNVSVLREQLQFNMSLNEPTTDEEMGGNDKGDDTEGSGYPVDYSLSYVDRYVVVRSYYMSIEDPEERLALYSADKVARDYLNGYYSTLFNYLAQFV